tara:strand:+ start:415 stop:618 length:204 start_codon:yes stop_codon:yes gene_type:complete
VTKVTLDDIEYDSKDFDDNQNETLRELMHNNSIKVDLEYQLASLGIVAELLMTRLKKSLTAEKTDDD